MSSVIASAPGRANLIGEHIDYAGGVVLPFAINARTNVKLATRSDRKIQLTSEQATKPVEISWDQISDPNIATWAKYPLGVLYFAQLELGERQILPGFDIHISSQVPQGAGLSSSAALECAVATALNALCKLELTPLATAKLSQRAEREFVGMPCGLMDQAASTLAEAGKLLAFDCADETVRLIDFDLAARELEILLIDSKVKHELVDGGYAARFEICQQVLKQLARVNFRGVTAAEISQLNLPPIAAARIKHILSEIARVAETEIALANGDFVRIGQLLNASHASLRDDYEVSCPELDLIQASAITAGALGGRIMGGGFGGSAIVLLAAKDVAAVKAAVLSAAQEANYPVPAFYSATAASGARVDSINE